MRLTGIILGGLWLCFTGTLQAQVDIDPFERPAAEQVIMPDSCANAYPIAPGETIYGLSNLSANPPIPAETPGTWPETCIPTIENDMWFYFTATAEFTNYTVSISHHGCNSPAGLQALLIQNDDCNAANFDYVACSSTMTEDSIKMYLKSPVPGKRYLIWIDGYDGAVCDYNLHLSGSQDKVSILEEFKFTRFDYDEAIPVDYKPEGLQSEFLNNEALITWQAATGEDVAFYVVEEEIEGYSSYRKVLAIMDPKHSVEGVGAWYEFYDRRPFQKPTRLCYRIIRVDIAGNRHYSESICLDAVPIQFFYVEDIRKSEAQPGFYEAHYLNRQKRQNYTVQVLDANKSVLKEMILEKIQIQTGVVNIDMREFDPGEYYFRMEADGQYFLRSFTVD